MIVRHVAIWMTCDNDMALIEQLIVQHDRVMWCQVAGSGLDMCHTTLTWKMRWQGDVASTTVTWHCSVLTGQLTVLVTRLYGTMIG